MASDNPKISNGYGMSKASKLGGKKNWNPLSDTTLNDTYNGNGVKLRQDDEVELTNEITGNGSVRTKGSGESGIVVKHDVRWESRHMDDV